MPEEKERREQEREARDSVEAFGRGSFAHTGSRFSPPQDKGRCLGWALMEESPCEC